MSDPKRATFITVGAPKSAKKNVTKTVRLTVNLDESNESKYPELNYKELVIGEEKKHKVPNGKPVGLDPFSDNDDDVERVARKFEQKYGSKSTYGSKGRSKQDEYADIGAGYDENDSFIDNTDGYDEMIPPGCDTLYGGFYINCGSLEFKAVPDNHNSMSDGEPGNVKRNKRHLSSSTSGDESSDSSSESESQDEKDKPMINGTLDSHKTEHRKKKNKKSQKSAKRIRRADSSAATSGKQTSDDNRDGESADSRTSHSDSLTSKPAPSSENPVTSDSSRDAVEVKLPTSISTVMDEMSACVGRLKQSAVTAKDIETATDPYLLRLEKAISSVDARSQRIAWEQATRVLGSNPPLTKRLRMLNANTNSNPNSSNHTSSTHIPHQVPLVAPENKKLKPDPTPVLDISKMTDLEREAKVVETLARLKALIDEKRPAIMQNYQHECNRVQEERKKQVENATEGGPLVEKRLPKRRFPWCHKSRGLLSELTQLSGDEARAAILLAHRALPLFPAGFVRIPTLMRQANISRDLTAHIKPSDLKKQLHRPAATHSNITIPPVSQTATVSQTLPISQAPTVTQTVTVSQAPTFNEPIHFPSSLTVTTTNKLDVNLEPDAESKKPKHKPPKNPSTSKESQLPTIFNSFSISKDVIVECKNSKEEKIKAKENSNKHISDNDKYLNSKGSFTITPVPMNDSKSAKHTTVITCNDKQKEHTIRVKSQATLIKEADELAKKDKDHSKHKHKEKTHVSKPIEKRVNSPLHIDTTFHKDKTKSSDTQKSSPNLVKNRLEEPKKVIDNLKNSENNIPRPGLIPVHSPTFAKPDKRAPDLKKTKKDILIISDMDPLAEIPTEPLAIDDSSSDVEVIGEEIDSAVSAKNIESVSSKQTNNNKKSEVIHNHVQKTVVPAPINLNQVKNNNHVEKMDVDDTAEADINKVMQNLREMQDSQDHFTSNSYGGVITSEQTSFNNMDGCNKDDSTSSIPDLQAETIENDKNV